jgi:hypothetical protein
MVVRERSGTQNLKPGELLGCRILRVGEHIEMPGTAYLFTLLTGPGVLSLLREHSQAFDQQLDGPRKMGLIIMLEWLQHWLKPAPLPTLIDHYSGEPMKMITDHYLVKDEVALAQALATQTDVEGDRQDGWSRHMDCTDGQIRARVHINPGKKVDQIELFYRTQRYADEGRVWFDALVGASVISHDRALISLGSGAMIDRRAVPHLVRRLVRARHASNQNQQQALAALQQVVDFGAAFQLCDYELEDTPHVQIQDLLPEFVIAVRQIPQRLEFAPHLLHQCIDAILHDPPGFTGRAVKRPVRREEQRLMLAGELQQPLEHRASGRFARD